MELPEKIETEKRNTEIPKVYGYGEDILQYFEQLNWDVVGKEEYRQSARRFIPVGYPVKNHTHELVNSEKTPFPENPYCIPPKEMNDEKAKSFYIPGVEKSHIIFPQYSALNKKEQSKLFSFMCRCILYKERLNNHENILFQELLTKAKADYPDFQEYVASQWRHYQYVRCTEVKPEVIKYIDLLWKKKCEACLSLYPSTYKIFAQDINLKLNDPNEDHTIMDYVSLVSFKGRLLNMRFPSAKSHRKILTDFKQLCKLKPVIAKDQEGVKPVVQPILPVSVDPSIDFCLYKHDVDVAISNSGIKAIVDTDNFKEWCLPVTIKDIYKNDGTTKKVVIVDKPLPPTHMSVHDKNKWHAKIAAKWLLVLEDKPRLLDYYNPDDTSRNPDNTSKYRDNTSRASRKRELTCYEDFLSDDLNKVVINTEFREVHTTMNGPKEQPPEASCLSPSGGFKGFISPGFSNKDKIRTIKQQIRNIKRLITDTDVKEDEQMDVERNEPIPKKKSPSTSTNTPPVVNKVFPNGESRKIITPRKYGNPPSLSYRLWRLHKSTHYKMSKHEQRTLNILVRSKTDGKLFYFDTKQKTKSSMMSNIFVSSRLEFQPEYGASQLDSSSLLREYVDLYLNQNLKMARVRFVGHTGEFMMAELKTLQDIQPLIKNPQKVFDPLYAVLTKLIDMPKGRYMLQHTPRMDSFAHLLLEDDCSTAVNLLQYCGQFPVKQVEVNVPPLPIDPFTLTSLHHFLRQPPALFNPSFEIKTAKFLKRKNDFNKKNIKKQEKKEKKKHIPATKKNISAH